MKLAGEQLETRDCPSPLVAIDDAAVSPLAPFCSQAVAMAYRAGGVDVVPGLSDHATEPADLARSAFFEYRCTLVP